MVFSGLGSYLIVYYQIKVSFWNITSIVDVENSIFTVSNAHKPIEIGIKIIRIKIYHTVPVYYEFGYL